MKTLFLTSNAELVLDKIVVYLPKPPQSLTVAFVPTAGNLYGATEWISADKNKFLQLGFTVIDVDISGKNESELRSVLNGVDIIFVAGGNTFYLLQEARKSGFDSVVTDLVLGGTIYIGSSAGALLVSPTIEDITLFDDPADAPELTSYTALGLVDFVPFVHIGSEEYKEAYFETFKSLYKKETKSILLTNNQFVFVQGDSYRII